MTKKQKNADPLTELSRLIKSRREYLKLSQTELAQRLKPPTNRSAISHLEQGRRLPGADILQGICEELGIPGNYWQPLIVPEANLRIRFEDTLEELVGHTVSLKRMDRFAVDVANGHINHLFEPNLTAGQHFDIFNSIGVLYGVQPQISQSFFKRYFSHKNSFTSIEAFQSDVKQYQLEAIRLFSTFLEAYVKMNTCSDLEELLVPIASQSDASYRNRTEWVEIDNIESERLPDLGYVAAARVRKEHKERKVVADFLIELADLIEAEGQLAVNHVSSRKKNQIESLLHSFESHLSEQVFSPLLVPDPDQLRREAANLTPQNTDLNTIESTQSIAERNLAFYLTADYLDVYVATSMRNDADFVSVNEFVTKLFNHNELKPLKLRYFNPTLSWIEDRVAKGLVEALMLRRANFTIYMAQKQDTFGKDSEASVALGQGKPVIVYVPKLEVPELKIDSEKLFQIDVNSLLELIRFENIQDIDESMDHEVILAKILTHKLTQADDKTIVSIIKSHWADFNVYEEAIHIKNNDERAAYREWLDQAIHEELSSKLNPIVRQHLIQILVTTTLHFERRAKIFREIHPLALQVILSSGVLNGMIVVRSVETCSKILKQLITNQLSLSLEVDEWNYRLVEESTRSTIRVISKHKLLRNAFVHYYAKDK